MKLRQFIGTVALAGFVSFGTAFAGDGGYYAPGSRTGGGTGMMDRFSNWLSRTGGMASFLQNPYVVARGGFTIYDDRKGSVTNGYNPDAGSGDNAPFDISRITGSSGEGDADLGGGFTLGFGVSYDFGMNRNYGNFRSEFEFGYSEFSSDYCFTGIPRTNPNAPGSALGRRLSGTVSGGEFTSEGPIGPQYPGITSDRATAQTNFEGRLGKICATYDEPTYHFVLHNYWDLKLGNMAAMRNMNMGMLDALEINVGVGIGYMLVEDSRASVILLDDAHEPRYGAYSETTAVDKVFDSPTPNARTRSGTGLIQYVPRSENGARNRDPNRDTSTEADDDLANTMGRSPDLESGLYIPISVGLSYDLVEVLDVPARVEFIYRYNAVAPKSMREAHGILFGVRYAF